MTNKYYMINKFQELKNYLGIFKLYMMIKTLKFKGLSLIIWMSQETRILLFKVFYITFMKNRPRNLKLRKSNLYNSKHKKQLQNCEDDVFFWILKVKWINHFSACFWQIYKLNEGRIMKVSFNRLAWWKDSVFQLKTISNPSFFI